MPREVLSYFSFEVYDVESKIICFLCRINYVICPTIVETHQMRPYQNAQATSALTLRTLRLWASSAPPIPTPGSSGCVAMVQRLTDTLARRLITPSIIIYVKYFGYFPQSSVEYSNPFYENLGFFYGIQYGWYQLSSDTTVQLIILFLRSGILIYRH